jgi:hypothetical protein
VDVAPALAVLGYRMIMPCLHGCGSTRFLESDTFHHGQHRLSRSIS